MFKSELDVQIKTISPRDASKMLEGNFDNRRVRQGTVDKYARDMAAGNWKLNGDAIRFNGDGRLADGQHRLLACIKAGKSFRTLVITGLPSEAKPTLDSGAKRSIGDVLRWRGEVNISQLGALITWNMKYERYASGESNRFNDPRFNVSIHEQVGWLDANPEVREAVKVGVRVKKSGGIPVINNTQLSGVYFQACKIDEEDANTFMKSLQEGVGLEAGSPILALRRWAERFAPKRETPDATTCAAVTIKAMNYWREGRAVEFIGWRAGGARAEPFPLLNP